MRRDARVLILTLVVLMVAVIGAGYYVLRVANQRDTLMLSGTIEATEIHVASRLGGQVRAVYTAEGDRVKANQNLVYVYSPASSFGETIVSPIDGVVLEQLVERGELAQPGSLVAVVADLNALTLRVYVPEDRYGLIALGQTYPVTVDSFPNEVFTGQVTHIADQAEFTPRNVQTVDGRKSTVFAITLELAPSGGKLKPGMPADVHFQVSP
ncbi:MAG: efflux RND transporter periplasmic adaptor subunit [Anaerolineae bacterium]